MIPPKADPRWAWLIANTREIPFTKLATKMLMTRLRIMECETNGAKKHAAIDAAHEFFVKNEAIVKDDIKLIFGSSAEEKELP
jgi:hypothetical protein